MGLQDILKQNGIEPKGTYPDNGKPDASRGAGAEGQEGAAGAGAANPGATSATSENAGATNSTETNAGTGAPKPSIDDATLLATLKERGLDVSSFEELRNKVTTPAATSTPAGEPTEEEKRQAEIKKKNDARAHALRSGLVSTNTLDEYAHESAMPYTDLAFKLWKVERLDGVAESEQPSDQELADEFHEEHNLFAEATDPKRIRKEKQLQKLTQNYIKEKYGTVLKLEKEYDKHITEEQSRGSYHSTVDSAVASLGDTLTISIKDGDKEVPFNFKVPADVMKRIADNFRTDASYSVFGKAKLDIDTLANAIKGSVMSDQLSQIISYIATTHAENKVQEAEKGRRGIPAHEEGTANSNTPAVTTNDNPNMKRHLEQNKNLTGQKKRETVPA